MNIARHAISRVVATRSVARPITDDIGATHTDNEHLNEYPQAPLGGFHFLTAGHRALPLYYIWRLFFKVSNYHCTNLFKKREVFAFFDISDDEPVIGHKFEVVTVTLHNNFLSVQFCTILRQKIFLDIFLKW